MARTHVRFMPYLALALAVGMGACDDEGTEPESFSLTFAGDATFNAAHGGQDIAAALVRGSDGAVIATRTGTVSASADPAFSLQFANALEAGTAYEVHYWIDSNFGGGTEGSCDPPANDHQWSVDIGVVQADGTHMENHRPGETSAVCATFD